MVATTVKSDNLTNLTAVPQVILGKKKGNLNVLIDEHEAATASLDEIGDVILMGIIPSNAVILDVAFLSDDLDSNGSPLLATDIGLYYYGDSSDRTKTFGTVVDVDAFGSAVTTFRSAVTTWTSLRFEAANIDTIDKEAWELAGLSSDPGGHFVIGITVTAAAATAAAGGIKLRVDYIA